MMPALIFGPDGRNDALQLANTLQRPDTIWPLDFMDASELYERDYYA
jgi:hypothetical protein